MLALACRARSLSLAAVGLSGVLLSGVLGCLVEPPDEDTLDAVREVSSGALGVAGQGMGSGSAGADAPAIDPADAADYEALARCVGVRRCPVASLRRAAGSAAFAAQGFDCVLSGLRDRVPGLYELQLVHEHSGGTDVRQHRLALTIGGDADTGSYAVTQSAQGEAQSLSPTRRCRLRAPEVYDDCLLALLSSPGEPGSPAPACLAAVGERIDGWLDGCEARGPDCD